MYVYRVEHPETGKGPYQAAHIWQTRSHDTSMHPTPWDDGIDNTWDSTYIFGFISPIHLKKWFNRQERRSLKRRGYKFIRVDVPECDILFGYKQVVFPRSFIRKNNQSIKENIYENDDCTNSA